MLACLLEASRNFLGKADEQAGALAEGSWKADHPLRFKPDSLAARPQPNPGFLDGGRGQGWQELAAAI